MLTEDDTRRSLFKISIKIRRAIAEDDKDFLVLSKVRVRVALHFILLNLLTRTCSSSPKFFTSL
jgi:hypothetical protein